MVAMLAPPDVPTPPFGLNRHIDAGRPSGRSAEPASETDKFWVGLKKSAPPDSASRPFDRDVSRRHFLVFSFNVEWYAHVTNIFQ
jgi:hypothetical protein